MVERARGELSTYVYQLMYINYVKSRVRARALEPDAAPELLPRSAVMTATGDYRRRQTCSS
jgi:hypothetical protein